METTSITGPELTALAKRLAKNHGTKPKAIRWEIRLTSLGNGGDRAVLWVEWRNAPYATCLSGAATETSILL